MKKLYTLLVIAAFAVTISAQAPQKMSYQAVIRNSSGALVANQAVGMKITILQGSAMGTVVYSETYNPNPQTNANGLLTIEIGGGLPITGSFSGINWAAGPYYLKTETDPSGGTNYTITGTSQLLSVPYAMHAKTVETLAAETDPLFSASPASGITGSNITNWNTAYGWGNHSGLYRPASWVPSWADVTGKPAFAAVATSGIFADLLSKPTTLAGYGITDADNSNTNEIQTLSLSGSQLSLSLGGGTVTLPSSGGGDNWGTQVVVTDATLAGNGTTVTPLRIADNGVTSAKIADGAVATTDLADNSVTSAKIVEGTITTADLANSSVTSAKILDGTIASPDIANGAVTLSKISNTGASAKNVLQYTGSTIVWDYAPGSIIRYTFLNADCNQLQNFTGTFQKIGNIGTVSKVDPGSILEVSYYGRVSVENVTTTGAYFEMRVDDVATTNGRANLHVKNSEIGTSGISAFFTAVFSGLSAGNHTISMWVRAQGTGTGTYASYNPGCWLGDYVIVREVK